MLPEVEWLGQLLREVFVHRMIDKDPCATCASDSGFPDVKLQEVEWAQVMIITRHRRHINLKYFVNA